MILVNLHLNIDTDRTNSPHMGDIWLRVENTDKVIMIEVKDHKSGSGTVMGKTNGSMIDKFKNDISMNDKVLS